jgi:acyl carrier protein
MAASTSDRVLNVFVTALGPIQTTKQDVLDVTLSEIGVDSLDLLDIAWSTENEFGIDLEDVDLEDFSAEGKTIRDWATMVERKLTPVNA